MAGLPVHSELLCLVYLGTESARLGFKQCHARLPTANANKTSVFPGSQMPHISLACLNAFDAPVSLTWWAVLSPWPKLKGLEGLKSLLKCPVLRSGSFILSTYVFCFRGRFTGTQSGGRARGITAGSRPARYVQWDPDWLGLHSETLSQKRKKKSKFWKSIFSK